MNALSRRGFLELLGASAAAAVFPGCCCGIKAKQALQLYSIRTYIGGAKDKDGKEILKGVGLAQALKDVAAIGFTGVEFAGYYGNDAKTVKAVFGRTVFRSTDESGIWTRVETRDFIVGKALIDFEPQVGDEIEFLGSTYEVLASSGEPAWRWSDAFHTAYRIHAKNTGG